MRRWLRLPGRAEAQPATRSREPVTHIVILDGTMSSLVQGEETNAGLSYKLLRERTPARDVSLYYEAGIQWRNWRHVLDVACGRGINRQIQSAYGHLASRYHEGDRIILLGYSRGAFAVRSLAGVLDRVGLLQARFATERNVRTAYRHYRWAPAPETLAAFQRSFCHGRTPIEMIGVWDTVKALGLRLPLVWRLTEPQHAFHDHTLSDLVRRGYQALALDESRIGFAPLLWRSRPGFAGHIEQIWFRGTHGDVGGHLSGFEAARPLANIPLTWILSRVEECGVALPEGWRERFPRDAAAPSIGMLRGLGKLFLARRRREVGHDPSEFIHPTARPHWREPEFAAHAAGSAQV